MFSAQPSDFPDVVEFIEELGESSGRAGDLFDEGRDLIIARAPGRLDLMGGIADYSGSLVLQWPIREATIVALQIDQRRSLTIVSLAGDASRKTRFEMPLDDFVSDGKPIEYEKARSRFRSDPALSWAAYAAGTFLALMHERGAVFDRGARILIDSRVPEGKGVSSSAAIEVAVMTAVAAAYDIALDPREIALLCQKTENLVVGAPCGVMDQMTSVCGEENRLLALLCRPAELLGTIALPEDLSIWGIDSGVRHSVGGGDYGSVRIGAFMGYRIIAEAAGLKTTGRSNAGALVIDDPVWNGYLSSITPSQFEQSFSALLPNRISGEEFLSRYAGTTDSVTRIDPTQSYAVAVSARHPVYEHFRVKAFLELLKTGPCEARNELLGELMYQSHASYSACGLGSDGTDLIVRLVRNEGSENGLFGAKITGGGSGGTVAVLGRKDAGDAIRRIADKYGSATGRLPQVFSGSSPGSAASGVRKVKFRF